MKPIVRTLFCLLLLLLAAQPVWGQEPLPVPVTAVTDRSSLSTDETLTLTITVNGSNAAPLLPPLDDFQIVGSSSATQISIINGVASSQATYRYTLRPLRAGDLTIGAVTATIDGQTYTTQPITVQVTAGSAPPAAPPPAVTPPADQMGEVFFVTAEVDKTEPYLGEQVTYTFRFYQGDQLFGQPLYERPEFTGFWSQETAQQEPQLAQVAGVDGVARTYRVATLQTILFPTILGAQTIKAARLQLPGSFGQAGVTLLTEEMTVTVRPLPQPAPTGFSGAVGQFTLVAELDKQDATVNDSLTLRVTLSGVGSLETIPDPAWPELAGWRAFADGVTTNTRAESSPLDGRPVFTGNRVYQRILIPGQPGQFTIPAITYTYFNPATGAYETAVTDLIPVTVTGVAAVATAVTFAAADAADDVETVLPAPLPGRRLPAGAVYLALLLLLALLAGSWLWRRRRVTDDLTAIRRAQAQLALRQARQTGADPYAASVQVILTYLSDKLGRPVGGLTRPALAALLAETAVPDELAARLLALLDQSDLARFAPGSPEGDGDLLAATEEMINELEAVQIPGKRSA